MRRVEQAGEVSEFRLTVEAMPDSKKTPIRISLDARTVEMTGAEPQRLECQVFLSEEDATQLSQMLAETMPGTSD